MEIYEDIMRIMISDIFAILQNYKNLFKAKRGFLSKL